MNKNTLIKISVIESILLVASICANVYALVTSGSFQFALNIVAVIFAFIYAFKGYKKEGQLYFRLFTLFLTLKEVFALINMALNEDDPAIALIIVLLCYTCALLLTFSLNLGKKMSYFLAISLIVLSLITVAFVLMISGYFSMLIYNLTRTLLACALFMMVYAKYQDKEARGTK